MVLEVGHRDTIPFRPVNGKEFVSNGTVLTANSCKVASFSSHVLLHERPYCKPRTVQMNPSYHI